MQQNNTEAGTAQERQARERIGLAVFGPDAATVVSTIVAAEEAGVRQIWMTQSGLAADTLTIFAAAAVRTSSIRLGTAVVPTYPRHPLIMAQQATAISDLAPGRLRLGIGPSHRPTIEGVYGIPMTAPLEHLREYVGVLRAALWEGEVNYKGRFFTVKAQMPRTPQTPRAGAEKSGRAAPPLVAHISVALSQDRPAVLAAARRRLGYYGRLPFYAGMFADAGFPIAADGTITDALVDSLVVSGDEATVKQRLTELLATGLDELLVMGVAVADAAGEQERLTRLIGQF